MSYDIGIYVRVLGCDVYAQIAEPEYSSPTYNLGRVFRSCMDWNYSQSEQAPDGTYRTCYYPCDYVLERVERGIKELRTNRVLYTPLLPDNGYGTLYSAIEALESLRNCIYQQAENIPLNCLYMAW